MNKKDLEIELMKGKEEIRELKLFIDNEIIKKLTNGTTSANSKIVTLTYELKYAYQKIDKLERNNKCNDKVIIKEVKKKKKKTASSIRSTKEYKEFRLRILERDNNKCTKCGSNKRLQIHHIKSVKSYPELALDENNVVTLCAKCHTETDNYLKG